MTESESVKSGRCIMHVSLTFGQNNCANLEKPVVFNVDMISLTVLEQW